MFVVLLINSHFGSICGPKISPGLKLARDMYRGHTNAIVSLMNDKMSSICFTLNDGRCHTHPAITSFTRHVDIILAKEKEGLLLHIWL